MSSQLTTPEQHTHEHYCAQCMSYWTCDTESPQCLEYGDVMGVYFVAKQCKPCIERLRKEALTIYLFELVARSTSETLTDSVWS